MASQNPVGTGAGLGGAGAGTRPTDDSTVCICRWCRCTLCRGGGQLNLDLSAASANISTEEYPHSKEEYTGGLEAADFMMKAVTSRSRDIGNISGALMESLGEPSTSFPDNFKRATRSIKAHSYLQNHVILKDLPRCCQDNCTNAAVGRSNCPHAVPVCAHCRKGALAAKCPVAICTWNGKSINLF